jgi:hypothetical protein
MQYCIYLLQRRLVGGAIGGQAHCNGWNGIHGMVSNTSNIWKPHVLLHSIYAIPAMTISLSSYSSSKQPSLICWLWIGPERGFGGPIVCALPSNLKKAMTQCLSDTTLLTLIGYSKSHDTCLKSKADNPILFPMPLSTRHVK